MSFTYQTGTPFAGDGIKDVSGVIRDGSYTAIIGHTGSGKSTILQHLNALLKPTSGTVTIGDKVITNETNNKNLKPLRQKVGMVFQFAENQLFEQTVAKDIAFGPQNFGVSEKDALAVADKMVKMVGLPHDVLEKSPFDLSGGQMRRVAIAGVLAMKPDCIVLDEPTAMLDPVGRRDVMETIERLNKEEGITVILITHYMDEAVRGDKVYVIDDGDLVMKGTPREIFVQVEKLKEYGLDVPQVTEVTYLLRKEGIDLPADILTVEEMVGALCQFN